jgi:hypothetical protein
MRAPADRGLPVTLGHKMPAWRSAFGHATTGLPHKPGLESGSRALCPRSFGWEQGSSFVGLKRGSGAPRTERRPMKFGPGRSSLSGSHCAGSPSVCCGTFDSGAGRRWTLSLVWGMSGCEHQGARRQGRPNRAGHAAVPPRGGRVEHRVPVAVHHRRSPDVARRALGARPAGRSR